MSEDSNSALTKLVGRVFPKMPNFFVALIGQCDLAVAALGVRLIFAIT